MVHDKSFGQKRLAWISRADEIAALGAKYQSAHKHKSAARNYQRAAELYGLAGLGLLSVACYEFAAAHYEQAELYGDASRCSSRCEGVDRWNGNGGE